MLKEIGLYGEIDKVARAIARKRMTGRSRCLVYDWMRGMCDDKADIGCLLWEQDVLV